MLILAVSNNGAHTTHFKFKGTARSLELPFYGAEGITFDHGSTAGYQADCQYKRMHTISVVWGRPSANSPIQDLIPFADFDEVVFPFRRLPPGEPPKLAERVNKTHRRQGFPDDSAEKMTLRQVICKRSSARF